MLGVKFLFNGDVTLVLGFILYTGTDTELPELIDLKD